MKVVEGLDHSPVIAEAVALLLRRTEVDAVLISADSKHCVDSVLETGVLPLSKVVWATHKKEVASWLSEEGFRCVCLDYEYGNSRARLACYLISAVVRGFMKPDDVVLLLAGDDGHSCLSQLRLFVPRDEIAILSLIDSEDDSLRVDPKVLWGVVELAVDIGSVRHAHVSGTMITVGNAEDVLAISKRFIFEPFHSCAREKRNILDPSIRKTFEKFTRLDGAFVVSEDGVVEEVVQTITAPVVSDKVPPGLGSRHAAAGAISLYTNAYVVVVSQSAGNVTVFRNGGPVLSLKAR